MTQSSDEDYFKYQFELAWEHFKFHADQRTKMFHFFLISIGLILNAFAFISRSTDQELLMYKFLFFCIGGLISTIFMSLDIRNVQLLKQSEEILCKLEKEKIYPIGFNNENNIKLGTLSREEIYDKYVENNKIRRNFLFFRPIFIDNIKHKTSIRFIEIFSIFAFWIAAIKITDPNINFSLLGREIDVVSIEHVLFSICLLWSLNSLARPKIDKQWELKAQRQGYYEKE